MNAKKKTKPAPTKRTAPVTEETVLVLRTCNADLSSYGGFVWPASGPVKCHDWSPREVCGYGLHGLLWGEGDGSLLNFDSGAKGLVVRVVKSSIVDLDGKVKFPAGMVEFCGDLKSAADYISNNGGAGRTIVAGTATAGDRGTATAGDGGTATAGDGGVICLTYWNGKRKRYKTRIAQVRDEDGDGELEPNTPYQLNGRHEFVKVPTVNKGAA